MKVSIVAAFAGTVILAGTFAAADPLPHQKSGLWREDVAVLGHKATLQGCIDAASEARMSVFSSGGTNKFCQSTPVTHGADGWSRTITCASGTGPKRATRAVVSGDFNSKLQIVMTSPPGGAVLTSMTDTWVGACKPGQRGGDIIMSNGAKINVMDTMRAAPKGAH